MRHLFLSLAAFLLLSSCGTEAKNLCSKDGCKVDLERQRREQCPPNAGDYHEISVKMSAPLPGNIAVELNGERRIDDCTTPAQKAPYVTMQRAAGNRIIVHVDHAGAYSTLPTSVSIKVLDLQSCDARATPVPLFTANDVPLNFVKEGGSAVCPAKEVSKINL